MKEVPFLEKLAQMGIELPPAPAPVPGAAYDPASQRIFLAQSGGDAYGLDPLPILHVLEVAIAAPPADGGVADGPAGDGPPVRCGAATRSVAVSDSYGRCPLTSKAHRAG